MYLLRHVFLISAMAFWSPLAWCHGVEGHVIPAHGYQVTAMYDDGEPMSYAAVEIKAPESEIAFQTGRTDRNGVMLFLPDQPGTWQAVVSDGMGHRLALEVQVTPTGPGSPSQTMLPPPGATTAARDRFSSLVAGVGVIFGLFGFYYGFKARRALRKSPLPT